MIKPSLNISFGNNKSVVPSDSQKRYGQTIVAQIAAIPEIDSHRVTYSDNYSSIELDFKWDVDEEEMRSRLKVILDSVKAAEGRNFWYNIWSRGQSAGQMLLAISHNKLGSLELQELLNRSLIPQVKKVEGVEQVNYWDSANSYPLLELNRDKVLTFNISIQEIVSAIEAALENVNVGTFGIEDSDNQKVLIVPSNLHSFEDILDISLRKDLDNNINLRIRDIGKIITKTTTRDSLYNLNGIPANYLSIRISSIADVKKTCRLAIEALEHFKSNNADISFRLLVNPATFIDEAIINLLINALIGGIIAVLIMYLFTGNMRNTIIVGISIPVSVIISFILMKLFNLTINIISLGGMAIGLGMVLDCSIVSLENIIRHLRQERHRPIIAVIDEAVGEVAMPMLSSTLTTIAVFFPIILTASYTKAILGDLSKAIVFNLSVSLLAAITIVPILFYLLPKNVDQKDTTKFSDFLQKYYVRLLDFIISSKRQSIITIVLAVTVFSASLLLFPKIKKEIIATPATTLFDISMEFPGNRDIGLTKKHVARVEAYLKAKGEIVNFFTYMWNPENGFITGELRNKSLFEPLKKEYEKKFPPLPDFNSSPNKWDPGGMPIPYHTDFLVHLIGSTTDEEVSSFAQTLQAEVSSKLKTSIRHLPHEARNESINMRYRPWALPLEVTRAQSFIKAASQNGIYIDQVIDKGRLNSLYLSFRPEQLANDVSELSNLPVPYQNKIIPLKAIADISLESSKAWPINFINNVRAHELYINFNSADGPLSDTAKNKLINKAKKIIDGADRPLDLQIEYPTPNPEIDRAFDSFKISLLAAIILVFLIIALSFNSIKYPLIILSTIPLAVTGVLFGLFITESTVSLNSMLGTILLAGLVVNNAILLIDFYLNHKKASLAANITLSIKEAARLRLLPILMTTTTTLLGALPVALALGESGEILRPLGISLFFGLFFSTLITLFLIPAILNLSDG